MVWQTSCMAMHVHPIGLAKKGVMGGLLHVLK